MINMRESKSVINSKKMCMIKKKKNTNLNIDSEINTRYETTFGTHTICSNSSFIE